MPSAPPRARTGGSSRLLTIDALRGIAILAVLALHIPHATRGWRQVTYVPAFLASYGHHGVTLFLLVSGFCIHGAVARDPASHVRWSAFWKRRMRRLYPPYAAAIAFSLLLGGAAASPLFGWDLATHLLLVHNLFERFGGGLGNIALWSLGMEEQLYALYAVFLVLRRRLPAGKVLLVVGGVTLAFRAVSSRFLPPGVGPEPLALGGWSFWPFAHWLAWVLGAVSAEAAAGRTELAGWATRRPALIGFLAGGLLLDGTATGLLTRSAGQLPAPARSLLPALAAAGPVLSGPLFALAFFVLMNRWVRAEREARSRAFIRVLAPVGVISYSFYLIHLPLVERLGARFLTSTSTLHFVGRYVCGTAVTLGAAAAFYFLVERHFLNGPRPGRVAAALPVPPGDRASA